jgi:hypothetical protein
MDLRPNSDLPSATTYPALDGMPRAGSPAEQMALQDSAWAMLEEYRAPSGYVGSRLSNAWLGERNWSVQLFYYRDLPWRPGTVAGLVAAALRRRHHFLFGTAVSPPSRPSAVWRLPAEEDAVERFFEAHYLTFSVLFPPDRSFAVHGNDGDFCVFAGPEPFVREAFPPAAIGAATTADVVAEVEKEHGKGCMKGVLTHYGPFMLDD